MTLQGATGLSDRAYLANIILMARAKGFTVDKRNLTWGLQYHSELSDMTGLFLQSYLLEPKDSTEHM